MSRYRGDAAVVRLRLGFHGDEFCAVLPLLHSPPHPPSAPPPAGTQQKRGYKEVDYTKNTQGEVRESGGFTYLYNG